MAEEKEDLRERIERSRINSMRTESAAATEKAHALRMNANEAERRLELAIKERLRTAAMEPKAPEPK